ncbi:TRAP transporter substrate-binding protein [Castellaniella sp.]|uniref:TRAP transporter substrate-binding protein n=1 Tax=Castellaniella sp. TaxID=1955812 RepID=UPI003C73495D
MLQKFISTAALGVALSGAAFAADLPKTHLNIVGNLSFDTATASFEKPFWTKTVPEQSGGAIETQFKSFNEMGLKGAEILRLMSQGVIEFGSATLSYFASDDPIYDAVNLVGMAPTLKDEEAVIDSFTPVYQQILQKKGIHLLGFGINPAQVLYCNSNIGKLADIEGKKVRISSRTQADFVDAMGGSSVNMAFAEVVPALQTGVIDCAITGSLSGFNAKWYEVSTHLLELPLNWNPIMYAVNDKAWSKLDPKVQAFVTTHFSAMLKDLIADVARQNQEGYDCNSGAAACTAAVKGSMKLVKPTQEDLDLLKKVAYGTVAPKWGERCSADCVTRFNETVGKMLDFSVAKR